MNEEIAKGSRVVLGILRAFFLDQHGLAVVADAGAQGHATVERGTLLEDTQSRPECRFDSSLAVTYRGGSEGGVDSRTVVVFTGP